jgi:hypothetical protein
MTDSKRLATMKALTSHIMGEVSIAKGYKHNLANAVFRGRMFFDKDDPMPCVSVLEGMQPDVSPRRAGGDDYEAPVQKDQWVLLVQGWVEDDKDNPTDPAYELMADVKKALAKIVKDAHPISGEGQHANYMLGGLISGMTMEPGVARPPTEQVSELAFFWLRITLQFVEDTNDPYAIN